LRRPAVLTRPTTFITAIKPAMALRRSFVDASAIAHRPLRQHEAMTGVTTPLF